MQMAEFVDLRRRLADETTRYVDPDTVQGIRNWFFNHVIAEDRSTRPTSSGCVAGGCRKAPPRDPPEYGYDPRQLHPLVAQRCPDRSRPFSRQRRVLTARPRGTSGAGKNGHTAAALESGHSLALSPGEKARVCWLRQPKRGVDQLNQPSVRAQQVTIAGFALIGRRPDAAIPGDRRLRQTSV